MSGGMVLATVSPLSPCPQLSSGAHFSLTMVCLVHGVHYGEWQLESTEPNKAYSERTRGCGDRLQQGEVHVDIRRKITMSKEWNRSSEEV